MARLLVEIDENLKRDLKVRLMREGETLKEWISRMAASYVEGEIPSAYIAEKRRELLRDPVREPPREAREPQSGKTATPPPPVEERKTVKSDPAAAAPAASPAPKRKDDIFFFD